MKTSDVKRIFYIAALIVAVSNVGLAKTITVTIDDKDKNVVPIPMLMQPAVICTEKKPDPPPPPEPSLSDASDPRKLVRHFCKMWKEENYDAMYWAMTPKYRQTVSFDKFKGLFESDAEMTGGLKDENIIIDDVDEGKVYIVTADLKFNFIRSKDRRVKVVLEKMANVGYRIRPSGILPVDFDDL